MFGFEMPPGNEILETGEKKKRKLASENKGYVLAAALTALSFGTAGQERMSEPEKPTRVISENPKIVPRHTSEVHGRLELSPSDLHEEDFELPPEYAQGIVRAKVQESDQKSGVEYRPGSRDTDFVVTSQSLDGVSDVIGEKVEKALDLSDSDLNGFEAARRLLPDTFREIQLRKPFDHPDQVDGQIRGWGDALVGEVFLRFPEAAGAMASAATRHAIQESILQQAQASRDGLSKVQFALDSRNPENMLVSETWKIAPMTTVKAGLDVLNYDLRFDPSIGIVISFNPSK